MALLALDEVIKIRNVEPPGAELGGRDVGQDPILDKPADLPRAAGEVNGSISRPQQPRGDCNADRAGF